MESRRMPSRSRAPAGRGFTYLTVLFIVAILSGGLGLLGEVWHTAAVREKEAELLFIGNQYRRAIERYYLSGPGQYPRTLNDLLKDPRKPVTERYLRRIYPDPITGSNEWGLIRAPDGGIVGVHSLSENRPLRSANFRGRDAGFETAIKYSEWQFVVTPAAPAARKPPAKPVITR
jgi:type II secretory pathway pseudopilin PulG